MPPILVTGSESFVEVDRVAVALPDLLLPDVDGRLVVAITLPSKFEGRVTPGR
jgi:hypothetical protein